MPPLLLVTRSCYSECAEPLALKLARWRAALSTAAADQPLHLGSDGVVVVDDGGAPGGAAAPLQRVQGQQQQQQHRPVFRRHPLRYSSPSAPPSFAASAVVGVGVGTPRCRRPFTTSSSPSLAAGPPPSSRPPPRSGAGLGGPSGGSGGGGGLASVIAAEAGRTRVNAYTDDGFVVNQVQVKGAVLCLPETWLMWDVDLDSDDDEEQEEKRAKSRKNDARKKKGDANDDDALDALVPPESLAVLDLVHPPPEVLVLGCGARAPPRPPPRLRAWLREKNMALELLRTADAVALFALLNDEGRPAVGAFLPPNVVLGE